MAGGGGSGTPALLTFGAGADVDPDISADGRRLVYTNMRSASALMLTDPATGHQTELLQRQADIAGSAFSPEGDRVAFFYQVETGVHVFTARIDGSELRQITHASGEVNAFPRWSADGAFLYFFRQRPTVSFLKVPVTGGATTEVGPWSLRSRARVDAAGKHVVFERREEDGAPATIVRDLATGRETTLPVILGYPRWTKSSDTVIGTEEMPGANSQTRQRIVACAIGGPCHVLADGALGVPSADDSRVFFLRPSARGAATRELWSVDRDGRNARQRGSLGPFRVGAVHYDVSARDHIVWTMVHTGENRIWLTEFR